MHDDQHGTAIVVLAGLLNALRVVGKKKENIKIVVNGAGAAGIAVVKLLLKYGFSNVIMCDSKGVIHNGRKDLSEEKKEIAEITNIACKYGLDKEGCVIGNLEIALKGADVFIGVSKGKLVSKDMIKSMNSNSIVFAMANPIPEVMPSDAIESGAVVVASGRSDFPNQVNNALAFPGVFRGALDCRSTRISEEMKIAAAEALAGMIEKPTADKILPDVLDKQVVIIVSEAVKTAWLNSK